MNIYDIFQPKVKTEFGELSFIGSLAQSKTILTVDATLSLEQTSELRATTHAVEKGDTGFITDHLNLQPLSVSIAGRIASEAIDVKGALTGGFTGAVGTASNKFATPFIGQIVQSKLGGALTEVAQDTKSRVQVAIEKLMMLQTDKIVLSVVTKLRLYTNMVLETLNITATDGDAIDFTGSLKEIRIVKTEYTTIKGSVKTGLEKKVGKAVNQGTKSANPIEKTTLKKGIGELSKRLGL